MSAEHNLHAEEAFALLAHEIVYAEGSWMCDCDDAFFVATAITPSKFVWCDRCRQGAWVFPWGGA